MPGDIYEHKADKFRVVLVGSYNTSGCTVIFIDEDNSSKLADEYLNAQSAFTSDATRFRELFKKVIRRF